MSTATTSYNRPEINYINAKKGIFSWLITTDHKRIGLMYFIGMMIFFFFGAGNALLMRLELFFPGMQIVSNEMYNRALTLHGISMIFLFVLPGIPAVFGNFFLPILLGAEDVSFPKLNLLSWYFFVAGSILAVAAVLCGGVDTGWTFYVPYSMKTSANVLLPMMAAFILGWSNILTGLNFITTIHRLRHKAMGWFDMPLFVWSLYATGWIQVIATPVVGITLVMVLMEKYLGVAIFDPARGGDPILYEHMFWIYSHPAVYIMILPAMGVVSEIIPTFARKTIFGYKFIAYSSMAIAGIGSLVWAHHMFTSGMADYARIVFSFLTFFVAVPSAVKVFNWVSTMYKGSIQLASPMVWALMFIFLFSIGGLTGMFVAALSVDVHLHDTAFVVAHFHYTIFGGTVAIFFAACHYWWPKMFGRMYNEPVAMSTAILFFISFNLTYMPLFIAGGLGMPRRYADYLQEYTIFHQLSTIGAIIMVTSIVAMFVNLVRALYKGELAEDSPWGGATLEWRTSTPPPTLNFDGEPDMSRGTYEYPIKVEQ
jgi:cytochrome c oxidase subunit 1